MLTCTVYPPLSAGLFGQGGGWSSSRLLTAEIGESSAIYVCLSVYATVSVPVRFCSIKTTRCMYIQYVRMYVCMYVFMYIRIYFRIYVCMYVLIGICV